MEMVIKTVPVTLIKWLNTRTLNLDILGGNLTGGSVKEKEVNGSMIK